MNDVNRTETSVMRARDLDQVADLSIPMTTVLAERIVIELPAGEGGRAGDGGEPTRIGFLSDMPMGNELGGYLDPIILAFEDAMHEGRLTRPVEIVAAHVMGLPTGVAENVQAAYLDLVAQGCVIVLSTGVTNNALVLMDPINASAVPLITMAGTTRFIGPHCFSLANGGHGEEAAILAAFIADQGYLRVVVTGEGTEGDAEYRRFFHEQAGLNGIEILAEHYFASRPSGDELDEVMARLRDETPDALVDCGFGLHSNELNPSLRASVGTRRR